MVNIVLDLDETLIHTTKITPAYSPRLASVTDFNFVIRGQYYWILKRPGLDQFLDFVYRYFNVMIWTAAEKEYAKQICSNILNLDQLKKTKAIYSRSFCNIDMSSGRPMLIKPLIKIYKITPGFNYTNTIMIDNSQPVMKYNKQNGIHVPDFVGNSNDQILLLIRNSMINYYKKIPIAFPIWKLVEDLNRVLLPYGGGFPKF